MRYYCIYNRIAKKKKKKTISRDDKKMWSNWDSPMLLAEMQKAYRALENSLAVSHKA